MNKRLLHTLVDHQGNTQATYPAIESVQGTCTYAQVRDYSNSVGNCLLASGVQKGEVIGLFMNSSIATICAMVGVFKSGAIYLPLDPSYPDNRLHYMLTKAKVNTIITDSQNRERLLAFLSERTDQPAIDHFILLDYDGKEWSQERQTIHPTEATSIAIDSNIQPLPDIGLDGDDPNYLLFTSGSTGQPKAILGCHKSLSHFIHWEMKEFDIKAGCKVSQLAPLPFDVSLRDIWLPLASGGTICIPPDGVLTDPDALLQWLIDRQIQLVHMVPSVFRLLIAVLKDRPEWKASLNSLQHIMLAGEALYVKDVQAWRAVAPAHVELVNLYGPSETTLAKVFHRIGDLAPDPSAVIPLGKAISNTMIIILKGNSLCKIGEIGEICIKTPFRSKGYYGDPELSAQQFVQNPMHQDFEDIIYRTGDLGRYLEDRTIAFVGRKDTQIKIRGNRVELAEIESCLLQLKELSQVLVHPIMTSENDLLLCCYYKVVSPIEETSLIDQISQHLPSYMMPSFFVRLEEFPLSLNGKIDRRALPKPEALLYRDQAYVAPSTVLEQQLAKVWAALLDLEKVGVTHSFFRLGGHSLTATKAVSEIYKAAGIELSLKEFFEHPTVRSLAQYLEGKQSTDFKAITPVGQQSHYELSFAQRRFWLLDQRFPNLTAYHMPEAYLLSSSVNTTALLRALKAIVARHESLRTVLVDVDGRPMQQIQTSSDSGIELIDQIELTENSFDLHINKLIVNELDAPFDLRKGPLYRFKLIRLPKEQLLLTMTFHHIIYDGWSSGIFINELLQLYTAFCNNGENPLEPLAIQYKDFAAWQNEVIADSSSAGQKAYWMQKMAGELPDLLLPYDSSPNGREAFEGQNTLFQIGEEQSQLIRNFCQLREISLYPFFVAAIKVLLYKYSGHTDICIGSPIVDRTHPDLLNQIGLYLNNVVLRDQLQVKQNFEQFLLQVKQTVLEAYDNQDYPYDKLVEDLSPESAQADKALYKVLVVMNNSELNGKTEDIDNISQLLDLKSISIPENTSKLDLSFFIHDDDHLAIEIEYRTAYFLPGTIQRLFDHLQLLMKTAIASPELSLADLVWQLSEKEEQSLLKNNLDTISENF